MSRTTIIMSKTTTTITIIKNSGTRINNKDAEHSLNVQLLNYQRKERLNVRIEITHLVQAKTVHREKRIY